ncbi:hypothetical protein KJN74_03815 [Candidatus Bathyarchaeota archaeon]|nr:hypothetical protein [Candidatus Bathyarchaeota archaeon]
MTTLRENTENWLPKVVSNIVLAIIFWTAQYLVQLLLSPINTEQVYIIQTGLLVVSGIFIIRALFNGLKIVDHLTKSFLKRLGIKEKWSRERILKDLIFIVAILLIAAGFYPIITLATNYGQILQQITTYATIGFILLFVFDIGRIFYKFTENRVNLLVTRFSNNFNEDEKTNAE